MARISTYAIDGTPVSSDKLIGTDTAGTVTKNYPLGDVADWLKSSGATAVLGQNNYLFQIALDPDEGRKLGSFSFENYGGDGTEFSAVTELKFSASSSTGQYVSDYLLSTVGQKVLKPTGRSKQLRDICISLTYTKLLRTDLLRCCIGIRRWQWCTTG